MTTYNPISANLNATEPGNGDEGRFLDAEVCVDQGSFQSGVKNQELRISSWTAVKEEKVSGASAFSYFPAHN